MQADMREFWRRLVDTEREPDILTDFGFNLPPEYVKLVGSIYYYTKGAVMPKTGGLEAQDIAFIQDMNVFMAGIARMQFEYSEYLKTKPKPLED